MQRRPRRILFAQEVVCAHLHHSTTTPLTGRSRPLAASALTVIFARAAGSGWSMAGIDQPVDPGQRGMQQQAKVAQKAAALPGGAARVARRCLWSGRRRPPRLTLALLCCNLLLTSVLLVQENNSSLSGLAPRRELGPPRAATCDRPGCCCGPCEGGSVLGRNSPFCVETALLELSRVVTRARNRVGTDYRVEGRVAVGL